jgi:hypothetical protein
MRHLEELERADLVHRQGRGVRGDPFRWKAAPGSGDAEIAQLFGKEER